LKPDVRHGALALAALAALPGGGASAADDAQRLELANRCVALATPAGRFVQTTADGYRATTRRRRRAAPIYLKPTAIGTYMLHDRGKTLLAAGEDDAVVRAADPGPSAEWAVRRMPGRVYRLTATETKALLAVERGRLVTKNAPSRRTRLRLSSAKRCRRYPEAAVGAKGAVFKGPLRTGGLLGYADAHLHVTADLRAGGQVVSGEAFNRFGVTEALGRDADVHGPDGSLDITGNLLRSGNPAGTHDTDGWPTFAGWPSFDTYTHQQVYYTWLQRSYMAGLRLVTAQLVEDEPLCEIEPTKSHSCDETETIALEAQRMRELQDYVDAQSGGRGRGWFRLVKSSREARRAIERGKLAVLMGVESSSPFGCSEYMGEPQCDRQDVDRGIALYRGLGIRSMFIAHWVDNAFGGAAFEEGDKGTFIASFQVQQTGHPFQSAPCPQPEQGETCNAKGLTELGEYLVNRLMDNHMLIEMDHLSEAARVRVLEIAEKRDYPLVSSHTNTGGLWTESDLRRLYAMGGFATARPDTAAKLAESILRFRRYRRDGQLLGVGIGTDTGGFAATPEPDPAAEERPLRYPFRSYDGKVSFVCQVAGQRKFDLNKDGVANYGLYADLLAYMRAQTGGKRASRLLFRSAESYLRTWRRAEHA
jgi:microsomal dipeptidase-like Zn-dependent dipeptidase